jgi:hypothetical protein
LIQPKSFYGSVLPRSWSKISFAARAVQPQVCAFGRSLPSVVWVFDAARRLPLQ